MGMTWDASELNRLAVDLGEGASRVGERVATAIRKSARDLEAQAKVFCPVDTGFLRSSIGTDINADGRSASMEAVIGPTATYGAFVEFGTSRKGPAAYMGPAFDRVAPDFVKAVEQATEGLL